MAYHWYPAEPTRPNTLRVLAHAQQLVSLFSNIKGCSDANYPMQLISRQLLRRASVTQEELIREAMPIFKAKSNQTHDSFAFQNTCYTCYQIVICVTYQWHSETPNVTGHPSQILVELWNHHEISSAKQFHNHWEGAEAERPCLRVLEIPLQCNNQWISIALRSVSCQAW